MQINPEIEQITDYAITIAKKKEHHYVLIEHLLLSLIRFESFNNVLLKYGVEVDLLEQELEYYEKCLQELLIKMSMVKRDIDLTNIIIDCIKTEKVDIMQKYFDKKDKDRVLDF